MSFLEDAVGLVPAMHDTEQEGVVVLDVGEIPFVTGESLEVCLSYRVGTSGMFRLGELLSILFPSFKAFAQKVFSLTDFQRWMLDGRRSILGWFGGEDH